MAEYLLGLDIGSSFIKAALIEAGTGNLVATTASPEREMEILAPHPGWAEQDPAIWWWHAKRAIALLSQGAGIDTAQVEAIGISYQMHGLVLVDKEHAVLRPAIIWCDSRAVEIGNQAFASLGEERCLRCLLNSPGNFTASKLRWVRENEPHVYRKIHKLMLPGDYIAMRLTGEAAITASGLSEGILWDYGEDAPSTMLMENYGIVPELLPKIVPTFGVQGRVLPDVAQELKLTPGIPVAYRAGDQPNNAFALKVLDAGEVAAAAGTSGVVYGITDRRVYDRQSRVNGFIHVTHTQQTPRYGVLLCVNGTGILNSWLKHNIMHLEGTGIDYERMNAIARKVPPGSEGLLILPYGNGAERTLGNRNIGASIHGLDFNRHRRAHVLRAAQEGIVFALNYGLEIMHSMGLEVKTVRAGHANLFLSPIFCEAFSTVTGTAVELFDADGAQGAARAAGFGAGIYKRIEDAFVGLKAIATIEPVPVLKEAYLEAYTRWRTILKNEMERNPQ